MSSPKDGMKTYTSAQVREAEKPLLAAGVPLMARASAALAAQTRTLLTQSGIAPDSARVLTLVGAGDNGGDALFASAILASDGATVTIVRTGTRVHEGGLTAALAAGAALVNPGGAATPVETETVTTDYPERVALIAEAAGQTDVILDGILGTGTSSNPALRGFARDVVAGILPVIDRGHGHPLVVAVDLPSGVGADDGAVPDSTVLAATITVTFGGCKSGLLIEPAVHFAGTVIVADIGLGPELERVAARG
ncbi:MAG: carbohydrate kinase [Subtercola sp.]|nr:carbohydrate kinase [Subtercola sp.]